MTREEIEKRLSEYQTYQRYRGTDSTLVDSMEIAVRLADGIGDPGFTIDVAHRSMQTIRDYIRENVKTSFEQLEQVSHTVCSYGA